MPVHNILEGHLEIIPSIVKTILIEVAWAAVKKKGSYYRARYCKLKSRRGDKKAIVAIAQRISKAIYNIIKQGDTFMDLVGKII